MKKCRYCGAEYPDDATVCAVDQTHLQPAAASAPEGKAAKFHFPPPAEEDWVNDFVTLVNCGTLPAADVIVSRLQAAGIEAFIPDQASMQALGGTFGALGYVRVQIAPKDYYSARKLLDDIDHPAGQPADDSSHE